MREKAIGTEPINPIVTKIFLKERLIFFIFIQIWFIFRLILLKISISLLLKDVNSIVWKGNIIIFPALDFILIL
jgi:hypothetical protein